MTAGRCLGKLFRIFNYSSFFATVLLRKKDLENSLGRVLGDPIDCIDRQRVKLSLYKSALLQVMVESTAASLLELSTINQ